MYPALPRWSDANNGVSSTNYPPVKTTISSRTPPAQIDGTSPEVLLPNPTTRLPPSPRAQIKRAVRSGHVFVNHNAAPVAAAAPKTSAPLTSSSSAALPPTRPSSFSTKNVDCGGHSPAAAKQPPVHGGGFPLFHYLGTQFTAGAGAGGAGMNDASNEAPRPPCVTKRQGLARGTTITNAVESRRYSDAPLSLGVEGVQTGEEVLVDATAVRRRNSNNNNNGNNSGPSTACQNPQDHVQVPQLKRQLEKANASAKSLTAANRRQKMEHDAQKAELEMQLAECETRLRAALTHSHEREGVLSQHVSKVLKSYSAQAQKAKHLYESAVDAHDADKAKWNDERASLYRELDAARAVAAAHAANSSKVTAQQNEVEKLNAELDALLHSSTEKQLQLEAALSDAQSSLNKTIKELQECHQVQQQCNFLVQQCRLFVLQVCQPGFSVVKGTSLEPVEKNRPEPTGFVLVPLTVLLHGYTLLPEGDRQDVIDHYDREAKALH